MMPPFSIRPYAPQDLDAVYDICLKTGDAGNDATHLYEDPRVLGHIYVGPYVILQPELAFVLKDQESVCGYILGALDTQQFYHAYLSTWLPRLAPELPKPTGDPQAWTPTQRRYHMLHHPRLEVPDELSDYPSHLHIDLLPRAQSRGNGTRMMHVLLDALKALGSPGVHLGVAQSNQRAQAFYAKLGFTRLKQTSSRTVFMGKRL